MFPVPMIPHRSVLLMHRSIPAKEESANSAAGGFRKDCGFDFRNGATPKLF
jgi:hypothetical protein